MVFGVAMNSKKNTLVALLIAANFTEIKGAGEPHRTRMAQCMRSPAPLQACAAPPCRSGAGLQLEVCADPRKAINRQSVCAASILTGRCRPAIPPPGTQAPC